MNSFSAKRKYPEVDMTEIGIRLRNLRKHKELTQHQAARLAGTTAKHISEAERGVCGVSLQDLASLCRLYDVSSDYILFGRIDQPQDGWIFQSYQNLTPEKKRLFREQTESLLDGLRRL